MGKTVLWNNLNFFLFHPVAKMTDASAPAGLNTEEAVKSYYGKTLKTSSDLKTSACTSQPGQLPKFIRAALSSVHDEVTSRLFSK